MAVLSILISFLLVVSLQLQTPAFAHSHLEAEYVDWGTDEYELFGLTQAQLSKSFQGKLEFDPKFKHAYITSNHNFGPQFILTFTKGQVSNVQRKFVDGAGCNIMGPVLTSKKEALQFSIDGLSKLKSSDPKDKTKLAMARLLLLKLESKPKPDKP